MQFKGEYFFLSNMYPVNLTVILSDGKIYKFNNAEALFQAQKNISYAHIFENLDGYRAKSLGKRIIIEDINKWNTHDRLTAMANCLYLKFSNQELLQKLLEIKEDIVEDNTWNDTFWGVYNGIGENMLGKMLMIIRDSNNNIEELKKFIISHTKK